MSKMSELQMDIVALYEDGFGLGEIADRLNCPLHMVDSVVNEFLEEAAQRYEYDDSMDGDAASALASAGWGTDEDYGGSPDYDW